MEFMFFLCLVFFVFFGYGRLILGEFCDGLLVVEVCLVFFDFVVFFEDFVGFVLGCCGVGVIGKDV